MSEIKTTWKSFFQKNGLLPFLYRAVQIREDLWWLVGGASKGQARTEIFHEGVFLEGPAAPEDADLAEACVVLVARERVRWS